MKDKPDFLKPHKFTQLSPEERQGLLIAHIIDKICLREIKAKNEIYRQSIKIEELETFMNVVALYCGVLNQERTGWQLWDACADENHKFLNFGQQVAYYFQRYSQYVYGCNCDGVFHVGLVARVTHELNKKLDPRNRYLAEEDFTGMQFKEVAINFGLEFGDIKPSTTVENRIRNWFKL
jgi:hypothetical protein